MYNWLIETENAYTGLCVFEYEDIRTLRDSYDYAGIGEYTRIYAAYYEYTGEAY